MIGGTIGMMIGGPLGAIAGGAIGHHLFDKQAGGARRVTGGPFGGAARGAYRGSRGTEYTAGQSARTGATGSSSRTNPVEERQAAYFLALFSILGKIAKADGHITREEGEMVVSFLDRMRITGDQRQFAIRIFNEAKNSNYGPEDFARQFAQLTMGQSDLRSSMIDMLFQIALADKELHPAEERMIDTVAAILGIADAELASIRNRYVGSSEHAYAVLGLSEEASDEEVKGAYRRLVQEYHPDRILSQGMPEEFVEYATQRFQEIQSAWETIKTRRGF